MVETDSLVTIEKIIDIQSIPNAHSIELAFVKGWQCIVKKDSFKIGDLSVYFSIDSIPDFNDPNTAFMKSKKRVRTMKMVGVLSQGLLGPLTWLSDRGYDVNKYKEDDDITKEMGATKYISPEEEYLYREKPEAGDEVLKREYDDHICYNFPRFVPKTDETRIQKCPDYLRQIKNRPLVITRKEDGTSCTYVFNEGEFNICSRNFMLKFKEGQTKSKNVKHYYDMSIKHDLKNKMTELNRNLAIQGEIVGTNINGNRLKMDHLEYRVFNIFDIDRQKYLTFDDLSRICETLGLQTVPLLFKGSYNEMCQFFNVEEMKVKTLLDYTDTLEYSKGNPAEGIVIKTDDYRHRISFKTISNNYLLKYGL